MTLRPLGRKLTENVNSDMNCLPCLPRPLLCVTSGWRCEAPPSSRTASQSHACCVPTPTDSQHQKHRYRSRKYTVVLLTNFVGMKSGHYMHSYTKYSICKCVGHLLVNFFFADEQQSKIWLIFENLLCNYLIFQL